MLEKLDHNIWVHEDSMEILAGARLSLRMTIVKLQNNSLWVHSPTALSNQLKSAVAELGAVKYIIGPSNSHYLWLGEWEKAFPEAQLYISAGIAKKLPLKNVNLLDKSMQNIWQSDLDHVYVQGIPFFNESVFLHLASQSLLVTDLIQNHSEIKQTGIPGLIWRFIFRPIGFKGLCIAPHLKFGFMIKNKANFMASLKKIQDLDFERIIVTHGDVIETNAKQVVSDLCDRFIQNV